MLSKKAIRNLSFDELLSTRKIARHNRANPNNDYKTNCVINDYVNLLTNEINKRKNIK